MTVFDALRAVCKEQTDEYAKTYARSGLSMCWGDGLRVQCLYVLSNLGGWRGERAREVKAVLKAYNGEVQ